MNDGVLRAKFNHRAKATSSQETTLSDDGETSNENLHFVEKCEVSLLA